MNTPWGRSQYKEDIAEGITFYATASHGGLKVKCKLNRQIPEYMRCSDGWYEEDCDWARVAVIFPEHFVKSYSQALDTFKNWDPEAYEKYFGVTLHPENSYVLRMSKEERQFVFDN